MRLTLICSSPTLGGLEKLLGEFFGGSHITIKKTDTGYIVSNTVKTLSIRIESKSKGKRFTASWEGM